MINSRVPEFKVQAYRNINTKLTNNKNRKDKENENIGFFRFG